jgi:hypothetical protein
MEIDQSNGGILWSSATWYRNPKDHHLIHTFINTIIK